MKINAETYPNIKKAFDLIAYDSALGVLAEYNVPVDFERYIDETEAWFKTLNEAEFVEFCIGGVEDIDKMTERSEELRVANILLTGFFQDWNIE